MSFRSRRRSTEPIKEFDIYLTYPMLRNDRTYSRFHLLPARRGSSGSGGSTDCTHAASRRDSRHPAASGMPQWLPSAAHCYSLLSRPRTLRVCHSLAMINTVKINSNAD